MAELLTTKVSRKELDNGTLPQNYVLCKQFYESEGLKTKSGIVIGVLTDLVYQDSDNDKDDSSHVADFAETALQVYKLPERLYFNPDDEKSMSWETETELNEGDICFTNPIETLNAVTLECEGEYYKIIPYEEIYCAKREIWVDKWKGTKKNLVVCLNGYVLLSEVYRDSLSELDVTTADKVESDKGIVKYFGSCNTRYKHPDIIDFKDLQVNDVVLFDRKASPFRLERTKYNNFFSEIGEIFLVAQRRRINMVLERK